jgi:hypothetical protein
MDLKYGDKLIILSDTSCFDYEWIDYYLTKYTNRYCLNYRFKGLDENNKEKYEYDALFNTSSFYSGILMKNTGVLHKWSLEKTLDIQNKEWSNDHKAINDARNIAANFITYYNKNLSDKEINKE